MVLLKTAVTAVEAAAVIAKRTPETLSETAKKLYTALVATAVETAKVRGHSPNTTHIKFHLPLEVLADVCGVHRVTAWRHLPALRELGLIDYRPHKSTLRGETRNSGTVWEVRLNPERGSRCRLSYGDLRHKWRDLQKDVYQKRTAYRQVRAVQQSDETSKTELNVSKLLHWTLPPSTTKPRLATDSCKARRVDLEAVLDVKSADRGERNKMIELAAQALSQALRDADSVSWYQKLLWQLLRRFDATGEDAFYAVYLAAQRARADVQEGFSRKGGAVLVSRLKAAPWWSAVMNSPPTRVGTVPN